MRRIGIEERRARLGLRHHLAGTARAGVVEVARDLVGLHATDPATVYLAARARTLDPGVAAVEQALYEDRALVRILGMRRTMFVEPVELMGVVQAACTDAIATQQRRLLVDLVGRAGLADDPPGWIEEVEKVAVKALEARGGATATELAKDDPRLAQQIVLAEGKPYEGRQSVVSRILLLLAAEGRIVRGRPRGSWVSGQYRWSVVDAWLPDGVPPWSLQEAQAELVRRWLRGFGPATIADVKWWTGLPMGQVTPGRGRDRRGRGRPGRHPRPGPARRPRPGARTRALGRPAPRPRPDHHGLGRTRLLPRPPPPGAVRPQRQRRPDHLAGRPRRRRLGPARDRRGRPRLLEDVGTDATEAIEAEAARLTAWLTPLRVTPRFRTPLNAS